MPQTTLVTIDPGLSTGVAIGTFSDTEPYNRTHAFQIEGGLRGFLDNFWFEYDYMYADYRLEVGGTYDCRYDVEDEMPVFVAEKFTPRAGQGFSHTLASTEPLRIEGALIALNLMPDYQKAEGNARWQQPAQQYFCGGSGVTEKRKRAKAFLKEHGLYLTGKDVGQKDAEDAISATLHALAYMRSMKHMPTLRYYFGGAS